MGSFQKNKPVRSQLLCDSAKGRECTIRIPGYCTYNTDETVLCHRNGGGGNKADDTAAAFGCSVCHDIVDFRRPIKEFTRKEIITMHDEGIFETQHIWIQEALIQVAGFKQ